MDRFRNTDGTYNGADALAQMSGFTASEVQAIADQVRANHKRLDGCAYHEFALLTPGERLLGKRRYVCLLCRGVIDGHQHYWHEAGRRMPPAGGNAHLCVGGPFHGMWKARPDGDTQLDCAVLLSGFNLDDPDEPTEAAVGTYVLLEEGGRTWWGWRE